VVDKDRMQAFFKAVASIKTEEEARKFFVDIATPAELQAMADRWLAARMLSRGKSYRAIAQETGMSVTTIGRVARYVQYGEGGYQFMLTRTKSDD